MELDVTVSLEEFFFVALVLAVYEIGLLAVCLVKFLVFALFTGVRFAVLDILYDRKVE